MNMKKVKKDEDAREREMRSLFLLLFLILSGESWLKSGWKGGLGGDASVEGFRGEGRRIEVKEKGNIKQVAGIRVKRWRTTEGEGDNSCQDYCQTVSRADIQRKQR